MDKLKSPSNAFMSLPFARHASNNDRPRERRLRGFKWIPNALRNHLIAWIGEFVGTFMFLFFAFTATQVANAAAAGAQTSGGSITQAPNASVLLYISLAFGFSLAVNVWTFFRISGGLFNPAVTLGLCLIGGVPWVRGVVVITAQIVGSIASAGVVSALFPGPMSVRTTLGGGTTITRGLFIEMFLTAQLVFTIFMLAAEKHKGTFLAPIGIGLSLFIAELAGVYYTGGSLNPARSFGPDVVIGQFDGYHWIYWVGPFLGTLVAVIFYRLIKILEFETANPGQDFDDKENEVFQPDEEPASAADVRRPNVATGQPDYVRDGSGNLSPSTSRGVDSSRRPGSQGQRGYDRNAAPGASQDRPLSHHRRGRSSAEAPATGHGVDSHNQYPTGQSYQVAPSAELGSLPSRF